MGRSPPPPGGVKEREMDSQLLDDIIRRLWNVGGGRRLWKQMVLSESEIRNLISFSKSVFLQQPNLLELRTPIQICGDIHGRYSDLLTLFECCGFPPQAKYLFLGDYVDHGKQNLETICLLLAYKIKYPENFFLLRGNHECAYINHMHGFYDECKCRFNIRLWKIFNDCFGCIPVAALVDEKFFCVHGGLSPHLVDLDQIRKISRPVEMPKNWLLCDLLCSDPSLEVRGWGQNLDRELSITYGLDKVKEFLIKHDVELICRAHQAVEDGYEFLANRRLITIFSSPNYRGLYANAGAIMSVDESLMCSFKTLEPAERKAKSSSKSIAAVKNGRLPPGVQLIPYLLLVECL